MAEISMRDQGLQELIHRLHVREFKPEHVQEAAEVVAKVQTHADSMKLAQNLITSPIIQVRTFAGHLLAAISPQSPDNRESPMGYPAVAEVIKQWVHEEAKPGKARQGKA